MLVHAKNIIGGKVVDMSSLTIAGDISSVVVDPENGAILALLLQKNFWNTVRALSWRDIVEWYKDGILVRDSDNIVSVGDIIKVEKAMKEKTFALGDRVLTQKGKFLGFLHDFSFDSTLGAIGTIIVKKRFSSELRIMSAHRILSILSGKIIIRDIIEPAQNKEKRAPQSLSSLAG
ncbi:PRC-barrel domain-containing protein [Candidatus Microgenomates bacterium]|nr:PRC-barrel domain-containing protein [Candidatus Microgenomates bacterium]